MGVAWSELACIIMEFELSYFVYAIYLNPSTEFRIDSCLCPEELLLVIGLPEMGLTEPVEIRLAFTGIEL
jgi:hypothetical protein